MPFLVCNHPSYSESELVKEEDISEHRRMMFSLAVKRVIDTVRYVVRARLPYDLKE